MISPTLISYNLEEAVSLVFDEFMKKKIKVVSEEFHSSEVFNRSGKRKKYEREFWKTVNDNHLICLHCHVHLYSCTDLRDINSFFMRHLNTEYHKSSKLLHSLEDEQPMFTWEDLGITGRCNLCQISGLNVIVFDSGCETRQLQTSHRCTSPIEHKKLEILKNFCSLSLFMQKFIVSLSSGKEEFKCLLCCRKIKQKELKNYHLVSDSHCFHFLRFVENVFKYKWTDLFNGFHMEQVIRWMLCNNIQFNELPLEDDRADKQTCLEQSNLKHKLYKYLPDYVHFVPKVMDFLLDLHESDLKREKECLLSKQKNSPLFDTFSEVHCQSTFNALEKTKKSDNYDRRFNNVKACLEPFDIRNYFTYQHNLKMYYTPGKNLIESVIPNNETCSLFKSTRFPYPQKPVMYNDNMKLPHKHAYDGSSKSGNVGSNFKHDIGANEIESKLDDMFHESNLEEKDLTEKTSHLILSEALQNSQHPALKESKGFTDKKKKKKKSRFFYNSSYTDHEEAAETHSKADSTMFEKNNISAKMKKNCALNEESEPSSNDTLEVDEKSNKLRLNSKQFSQNKKNRLSRKIKNIELINGESASSVRKPDEKENQKNDEQEKVRNDGKGDHLKKSDEKVMKKNGKRLTEGLKSDEGSVQDSALTNRLDSIVECDKSQETNFNDDAVVENREAVKKNSDKIVDDDRVHCKNGGSECEEGTRGPAKAQKNLIKTPSQNHDKKITPAAFDIDKRKDATTNRVQSLINKENNVKKDEGDGKKANRKGEKNEKISAQLPRILSSRKSKATGKELENNNSKGKPNEDEEVLLIPNLPRMLRKDNIELYNLFRHFGKIKEVIINEGQGMLVFENSEIVRIVLNSSPIFFGGSELEMMATTKKKNQLREQELNPWFAQYLTDPDKLTCHLEKLCDWSRCWYSNAEAIKEETLCRKIENAVKKTFPRGICYRFGSRVTGLSIDGSDLDVFFDCGNMYYGLPSFGQKFDVRSILYKVSRDLEQRPQDFSDIQIVASAKIPIVSFVENETKLKCDLSFTNGMSVQNSLMIRYILSLDDRVRPLVLILKQWVIANELHARPLFSSYALTLMVIFFLQQLSLPILPTIEFLQKHYVGRRLTINGWDCNINTNKMHLFRTHNKSSLRELMVGFFEFYAHFNYQDFIISPLTGAPIARISFAKNVNKLPMAYKRHFHNLPAWIIRQTINPVIWVMDPFELGHNVTNQFPVKKFNSFVRFCRLSADYMIKGLGSV